MTDENSFPNAANQLAAPHTADQLKRKDEPDTTLLSPPDMVPSRKRSHSVLRWIQKNITHTKSPHRHEYSPGRPRSSTATTAPRDVSPSVISPVIDPPSQQFQTRARASTYTSVGSTSNKVSPPKKVISATDEAAQQSPSIFQFAFLS